jgi:hypothetical protein
VSYGKYSLDVEQMSVEYGQGPMKKNLMFLQVK